MKTGLPLFLSLLCKDLKIEMRRGELSTMIIIGVIGLSIILSYGAWLAGLNENERLLLAPTLSLSVLLMTAMSVIGKFSEYDSRSNALEGLLTAGVSSEALFLSRVASIFLVTFGAAICSMLALPTLLGLSSVGLISSFAGIGVCIGVSLGLSATGALLAPITTKIQVGGIFLLTLMLPLVVPLFFAGSEILSGLPSGHSFWWTTLVSLDAIYLAAGLWLHPHVLK